MASWGELQFSISANFLIEEHARPRSAVPDGNRFMMMGNIQAYVSGLSEDRKQLNN
jgi:hypothetical protein